MNLAFTASGLAALGVPPALLQAFPDEFREGRRRAPRGSATAGPTSSRRSWRPTSCSPCTPAATPPAEAGCAALLEENAAAGRPLEVVQERAAGDDDGAREPFGFADGGSQPAVEGVRPRPRRRRRLRRAHRARAVRLRRRAEDLGIVRAEQRGWRLIRAGEFLLGHAGEDGAAPPGPPAPLGPQRDVHGLPRARPGRGRLRGYVAEQARRVGMHAGALQEKIVGRRRDGRHARSCGRPRTSRRRPPDGHERNGRRRRSNDFLYAGDPHGYRCPLGAHVRRTNPRDALPGRRRADDAPPDHPARHALRAAGADGLVFICLSRLDRERLRVHPALLDQRRRRARARHRRPTSCCSRPTDGRADAGTWSIPGYRPVVLPPPERPFVTVRGCEYLLRPLPPRVRMAGRTQRAS